MAFETSQVRVANSAKRSGVPLCVETFARGQESLDLSR
jgi:hypothetical protein